MSHLYLCFYGDGPHWDNIIKIPAYPKGYSYFRPFRYRDNWINPTLLKEIEEKDQRHALIGKKVIICMRFWDENFTWHLLPVREAELSIVDYEPDNHSVYFRLGPIFDFGSVQDLRSACLEIPSEERSSAANTLLFRLSKHFPNKSFSDQINEEKVWVNYCDLIARDNSLPISEEARNALFLRFGFPENDTIPPVTQIHSSSTIGSIHGSLLTEGKTYEIGITHRIPSLITRNISIRPINVDYKSPTSNFEISPSSEEMTGNYQKHILTISANSPSGAWEEIIISPPKEAETQDGAKINTVKLSIPVRINQSFWYRFKKMYILLIVLWVALFASIVMDKFLGLDENKSNVFLIIGIAITTLISSIMIFILQQRKISV